MKFPFSVGDGDLSTYFAMIGDIDKLTGQVRVNGPGMFRARLLTMPTECAYDESEDMSSNPR